MNDITGLTAQIISAHVSGNNVSAGQLPTLIRVVHETLATIDQSVAEPPKSKPAVSVHESVFADRIVCLDCGKGVKILKRHISAHDLTPDHYRAKWGLPPTYPMVTSEYAAQRSHMGKDRWLGRKAVTPPPPPPRERGRPAKGK